MPSVIGRPFRPEVLAPWRFSRLVLSAAQVNALNGTPVTLVTVPTGYFAIPDFVHLVKDAGTAYTLNGATAIGIFSGATAIATVNPTGFMDQTGALTAFAVSPNQTTTGLASFTAAQITAANGTALTISNNTANLSGGTGNLTVFCAYYLWPMVFAFV